MAKKDSVDRDEQRTRVSGAGTIRGYLAHRSKAYVPPWVAAAGVGVAGGLASIPWQGETGPAVALTLGSVVLTGVTWAAGRVTTAGRRIHATCTVAAASGWLTAAALAGPFTGPVPDAFLMGAPVVAVSWNIRRALKADDAAASGSGFDLLEKVGLAGKLGKAKVEPNRATAQVALEAGEHSNDDMAKALKLIASALDVRPEAVRYLPDPDSARRGELVVVPEDMLKETVWWPGPSSPGGSIGEPVVVGVYEQGAPLQMWFPGDPEAARNAMMLLTMGMTGSGKSEGMLVALADVLTRSDVVVWASDAAKGTQTLGPLLPALDWAALDMPSSEAMVEAVQAAIPARTTQLAEWGYKQWVPEVYERHGMPYMIVVVEEAAKILREGVDLTGLVQEARSAGISIVLSLQRASHGQMPTDTRASLGSSWVYGVRDSTDAGFALADEAVDAGARPEAWKDKRPGYCYVCANGVPESEWATPGRTFRISVEDLQAVAVDFADVRASIDPVTAAAAMKAAPDHYGRPDVPAPARKVTAVNDDDAVYEAELDEYADGIDPERPLPEAEPVLALAAAPAEKPRDLSPEEARAEMERLLAEFEADDVEVVGPKDFLKKFDGRSRPWISGQVAEMVAAGRLAETAQTGRYRIVSRPLTAV